MFTITDQLSDQSLNIILSQMIPLFSSLIRAGGFLLMLTTLMGGFLRFIAHDGDPREMGWSFLGSLMIGSVSFTLPSLLENILKGPEDKSTSSSPFASLPLKSIGIGLGITIIIIAISLIAWRVSKSWRDKRAIEKGHQKVMREIWRLRSRIADGAFDEQGLDILNALAYIEDLLITFKVYRAEATQAEQSSLFTEIKPKLDDIISRFGNAWKATAIENALKNIPIASK